jgi:hypothetical protein
MQSEGKGSSKSKAVARVIINTKKTPQTDTVFVSFFHRNPKSVRERERDREIVRESTIEETSTAPRPLTVSIPFHDTTCCVHPRPNKSAAAQAREHMHHAPTTAHTNADGARPCCQTQLMQETRSIFILFCFQPGCGTCREEGGGRKGNRVKGLGKKENRARRRGPFLFVLCELGQGSTVGQGRAGQSRVG